MLKVRIMGLPLEVMQFADAMDAVGIVVDRSRPYRNRAPSQEVRTYLEIDVTRPAGTARFRNEGETCQS